jgi:hypothetical protein
VNLLEVVEGEGLGGEDARDHLLNARNVLETFFEGKGDVMLHEVPVESQEKEQGGEGAAGLGGVPRSAQRVDGDEYGRAVKLVDELARLSRSYEVGVANERTVVLVFLGVRIFPEIDLPNVDECVADLSCAAAGGAEAERVAVVQSEFSLELDDEKRFVGGKDGASAVERLDIECAGLRAWRGIRDLTKMSKGRRRGRDGKRGRTSAGECADVKDRRGTDEMNAEVARTWGAPTWCRHDVRTDGR